MKLSRYTLGGDVGGKPSTLQRPQPVSDASATGGHWSICNVRLRLTIKESEFEHVENVRHIP